MPFPDPVRLAVQVEEPACGRERGAPASADRVAAEGARSRPAHEQRPVVLGPPVPMVSSGPQGHHDHPARDPRALASEAHLRRVLRAYAHYYNAMRTHRSLDKDAPR